MEVSLFLALAAMMAQVVAGAEDGTCTAEMEGSSNMLLYVAMCFAFPTIFWIVAYSIPQLIMAFRAVPDLKKRYDAEWALVTGGKKRALVPRTSISLQRVFASHPFLNFQP